MDERPSARARIERVHPAAARARRARDASRLTKSRRAQRRASSNRGSSRTQTTRSADGLLWISEVRRSPSRGSRANLERRNRPGSIRGRPLEALVRPLRRIAWWMVDTVGMSIPTGKLSPDPARSPARLLPSERADLEFEQGWDPARMRARPPRPRCQSVHAFLLVPAPVRVEAPLEIPRRRHTSATESPVRSGSNNTCNFNSSIDTTSRATAASRARLLCAAKAEADRPVRRCQRCIRNVKDVSGTKRPLSIRIKHSKLACARQSRASEALIQAVLSGLERTSVRATRFAAYGSTMRDLAWKSGCPRQESNLRTRFRKPLLFH